MKFTKRGVTYVHHCIGSRLSHSQKTLQWPILESNTGFHSGQLPPMTRSHTITMKNGNDSIRCRNGLGHLAPPGLTGERYISHWATRFGKDSNHNNDDDIINAASNTLPLTIKRKSLFFLTKEINVTTWYSLFSAHTHTQDVFLTSGGEL